MIASVKHPKNARSEQTIGAPRGTQVKRPSEDVAVLRVQNLAKGYSDSTKTKLVLNDVSFKLFKGERIALLGPNGSGKSTLLRLILQCTEPSSGTIVSGRSAGLLELGAGFDSRSTGLEGCALLWGLLGGSSQEYRQAKQDIIDWCDGLPLSQAIRTYSKGMLARLAIGVLLHFPARLLVIDELVQHLDEEHRKRLLDLLQSRTQQTFIIATHDLPFAKTFATKELRFFDGRLKSES